MPYSYAVYTGNGATTQFTVPFAYLRKEHVAVSVNYVATAFTWVNDSTVQVTPAPASAARVEVRRTTPVNTPLVDFTDGSTLVAADLDTNALQQTYINQEQDDQIQQGIYVDANGNLTAGNQQLNDLLDPTEAQDAATKNWVETAGASPLVQFRSIFYGAYATDPAVDPYGAARTEGDLYFNTTLDQMRVFNGTSWQEASADATITRFKFTAAGGETSLSGNDDNAEVLTYNVGLELVYLNGALLTRGVDYVATTGSSITGLVALAAADLVEVVAFSQINALDSIPGANIADGTITEAKLASGAVTEGKIGNGAVTEGKLASGAVTSGKIADDTIVNADVNASAGIVASKLSFTQAGAGAAARTVDSKLRDVVSVKDFGAVGDGVADDTAAIQAALDYAKPLGKTVVLPGGTYGISSPLVNNSAEQSVNYLWPATPNGILLEGDRAIVKALSGFPVDRGMIELDSNPTDQQNYQPGGIPYVQVRNNISGIKLDGNDIAERGLYLRGTYYSSFSDLIIENLAGGSNDGAIHFGGVTTATKDDVDTVGTCSFNNIQIQQCDGYGVLAVNNRPSHITFSKVVVRNVLFCGFRMCGAFLTFRECITVNCGSEPNSQTGGYQIVKGATGALTRAVHFLNCGFEANAWFEFSIEYCNTWSINGCGGTPYKKAYTSGQTLIQAGTGADLVTSGTIISNRFQTFGNYNTGPVTAIKAGANCSELLLGSNDIDSFYFSHGVVYDIDAAVRLISIGQQSTDPNEARFNVTNKVYVNKDGALCVNRTGIVQAGNQIAVQGSGSGTILGFALGATSGSIDAIGFSDGSGTLCGKIACDTTANTTSYTTTSDYRLKENVAPIANASGRIKQLHPCRFNFIEDPLRTFDGFIAHEVQAVIPEAIVGAKDAVDEAGQIIPQGIDQSKIVPLLTAALQEAVQRIEALEAEVAVLKGN